MCLAGSVYIVSSYGAIPRW